MKLFHRLAAAARWLLLVLLLGVALGLTAVRLLLPKLDDFRHVVEAQIGAATGDSVRIGALSGRLRGLQPELVLTRVELFDAAHTRMLLSFRELRLGFRIWDLIAGGDLEPAWVTLLGASLSVTREVDGRITVAGIESGDEPPLWLFRNGRFELLQSRVEWQDLKLQGPRLAFSNVDMEIVNDDGRHQVAVALTLPPELGDSLTLLLDYRGNVFRAGCCSGRLYAEGKDVHLDKLLAGQVPAGYAVKRGSGSFRLWSDWRKSELEALYGEVSLAGLALARHGQGAEVAKGLPPLRRLSTWFRWRSAEGGWRLETERFTLLLDGDPWPASRFTVAVKPGIEGGPRAVAGAASYLKLDDVATLLSASGILEGGAKASLSTLAPRGEMHDLEFVYAPRSGEDARIYACFGFSGFGVEPWEEAPGVRNISGSVCGDESAGAVRLATRAAVVDLAGLLRAPLPLSFLEGEVRWRQEDDAWAFSGDGVRLDTPDIATRTRLRLNWPKHGGSPFLDLQTDFENANAVRVKAYLPAREMPRGAVEWLDTAFVSGRASRGSFLFFGGVDHVPFDRGQGVLEALFDTERVELMYDPGFMPLVDVDAKVLFYNSGMRVWSKHARLAGASVETAEVAIPDLRSSEFLNAKGSVRGTVRQGMNYLQQSRLHGYVDPFLEYLEPGGRTLVGVDLKVPLVDDKTVAVDGSARIEDGRVRIFRPALDIEQVNGTLRFDTEGLSANGLRATFLGAPLRIGMQHDADAHRIEVDGKIGAAALAKRFPSELWSYLDGASPFRLSVAVPNDMTAPSAVTEVALHSDLRGVAVDLPVPFGKSAAAARELAARLALTPRRKMELEVNYGGGIDAALLFSEPDADEPAFHGGVLAFGDAAGEPADTPGLMISGQLDEIRGEQWERFLSSGKDVLAGERDTPGLLRAVDLRVRNFFWEDRDFGFVEMHGLSDGSEWSGRFGTEVAQGSFSVPLPAGDESAVSLNLDYLKMPEGDARDSGGAADTVIDPDAFPAIRADSARVLWKGHDLGSLRLETVRGRGRMDIKTLELRGADLQLALTGAWERGIGHITGSGTTGVHGTFESADLGKLLRRLQVTDNIEATPGTLGFSLNWPGAPYQFSAASVGGDLQVKFGEGRLLDVEPGIARLLGLFSLAHLKRRLTLDFSDLFRSGLAYDSITGSYKLGGGNMVTQDFVIDAVPAKIELDGRVGLAAKDVDQVVRVTPRATTALPIAGTLVGGPIVGAAVLVAQQVVGDKMDGLASSYYAVTGPWDDPVVEKIKGGGPLGFLHRAWSSVTGVFTSASPGRDERETGDERSE